MMVLAVVAAMAVLALCLFDWRRGLLACLLVGFAQDPLRKLVPGRPVAFVVAVAVCFAVCLVGLFATGERLALRRLFRWFPRLRPAATFFVLIVVIQTIVTILRTGNPVLAGIGLLAYLSPPLALLLAERYAADFAHFQRWLRWYLAGALVVGGSVVLQSAGWSPEVFVSVSAEWVHGAGGSVRTFSGLMRTSEIAAWHAAAGACLLFAWGIGARTVKVRWFGGVGAAGLLATVLFTGRRKMLAEIVLFVLLYGFLALQHRRGASRLLQVGGVALVAAVIGLQLRTTPDGTSALGSYLERGISVFADAGERLGTMTIGMFGNIVRRNGFFGAGAGTGAQGSQYFGGGIEIVGGAAEGGVGKVLAELGVPGLIALLWLAVALGRAILRIARFARVCPAYQALRIYGLAAFLPANAAVFITAHQVFGDPFVLIVLGLVAGSILAYPKIVLHERQLLAARAAWQRPTAGTEPIRGRR